MACHHFDNVDAELKTIPKARTAYAQGCRECVEMGSGWVHLRECLVCGHVACCDSSPNKHATKHYRHAGHETMRSVEPGETWGWCFKDEVMVDLG